MTGKAEQLYAVVHGRVQGVNFRWTTQQTAARLGLHGWVRNRHDGTVEVTAEGPPIQLRKLLNFLRQGPPAAVVTDVEVTWRAAAGQFDGFRIT